VRPRRSWRQKIRHEQHDEFSMSEEEQERSKQIAKAAVKEFMDQVYRGVGKGLIERVFWIAVGALMALYFGGHLPK
jgi:hypothetical protein